MIKTTQTNLFVKSAQSSVENAMESKIKIPPIVGVPSFLRCVCGPSSRTACPIFLALSQSITLLPTKSDKIAAVKIAKTERKVM